MSSPSDDPFGYDSEAVSLSPIKKSAEFQNFKNPNPKNGEPEEKSEEPKKPARERRFFKNRAKARPVSYQFSTGNSEPKDDTFKMPSLPGAPGASLPGTSSLQTAKNQGSNPSNNQVVIPVAERLSESQSRDADLAMDVKWYLDGIKSHQGKY